MNPQPCPSCKGKCCVTGGNLRIQHAETRHFRHTCSDCEDGTREAHPIPAPEPTRAYEEGVAAERVATVAHLRSRMGMYDGELPSDSAVCRALHFLILEIERGEHHAKASP